MRQEFRISSDYTSKSPTEIYGLIEGIINSNRHYKAVRQSGVNGGVFSYLPNGLPNGVTIDLHLDSVGFTADKNEAINKAVMFLRQIARSKGLALEEIEN